MAKHAIFLTGPIGTGKTTLGRALAERLSGGFVDGDDVSDPDRPWYCSILSTSRAIVQNGAAVLNTRSIVVIAYPLGCTNWIYFRRKFAEAGAIPVFVSLRATYAAIVDERRGRVFSAEEHARIRKMIAEGYRYAAVQRPRDRYWQRRFRRDPYGVGKTTPIHARTLKVSRRRAEQRSAFRHLHSTTLARFRRLIRSIHPATAAIDLISIAHTVQRRNSNPPPAAKKLPPAG